MSGGCGQAPGFEQTALRLTRGEVGDEEVAAQVVPVVTDVVKPQVGIGLDFCKRHGFPPWHVREAARDGVNATGPDSIRQVRGSTLPAALRGC